MHIRVSRRVLRNARILTTVVVVLVGLFWLGDEMTPRDAQGRPLILSPSVRAAERYRRSVRNWVDRMKTLDDGLNGLLAEDSSTDPAKLYEQSERIERLIEKVTALLSDAEFTPPPPALVGLQTWAQTAAEAHFEATQAAAFWLGAPQEDNLRAARGALQRARGMRRSLEASRWLLEQNGDTE
jgi:hypothetical protein